LFKKAKGYKLKAKGYRRKAKRKRQETRDKEKKRRKLKGGKEKELIFKIYVDIIVIHFYF
jgi:hypothetical protein